MYVGCIHLGILSNQSNDVCVGDGGQKGEESAKNTGGIKQVLEMSVCVSKRAILRRLYRQVNRKSAESWGPLRSSVRPSEANLLHPRLPMVHTGRSFTSCAGLKRCGSSGAGTKWHAGGNVREVHQNVQRGAPHVRHAGAASGRPGEWVAIVAQLPCCPQFLDWRTPLLAENNVELIPMPQLNACSSRKIEG